NAKQFRYELEQQSRELIEIYDAPLVTARPDEEVVSRYAEYLQAVLPKRRLDLVVAVGASAVRILQRHRAQLFPSVPILAIAEERRTPSSPMENSVVVSASIDFVQIVDNILQVRPETGNIAVVIGNSPNERFWLKEIQTAFERFKGRV